MIQIEHDVNEKPRRPAHILHFNGEPLIRFEEGGHIIWLYEEEVLMLRARRDALLRANAEFEQRARDAREAQAKAEAHVEHLNDYLMTKNRVIEHLRNQLFDTERLLNAATTPRKTWWKWFKGIWV